MRLPRSLAFIRLLTVCSVGLAIASPPLMAQSGEVIVGRAINNRGAPATDAEVRLVDLGLRAETDDDGRFRFEDLAPGSYLVEISSPRFGRSVQRLTAGPTTGAAVTVVLEPLRELDEIVVSASPRALRGFETAQALSVLSGSDLAARAAPSLGETLANEPGLSSSYFGPGASRPLIRGLGGDRVRVLEGGVGAGDASSTSPDHAVSIEPRSAQRIEVVRGPATLLYGSSAIGGVVNVIDRRIPSERLYSLATGYVEGLSGTVANEVTGSFDLTTGVGPLVAHVAGLRRTTDDFAIPGFADADHPERTPGAADGDGFGRLENSFIETSSGDVGASFVSDAGYFGVSYGGLDSRYGVPGQSHAESDPGEEGDHEEVSIDLETRRWDVEGVWRRGGELVRGVKLRFGLSDYQHVELEGAAVGTTFLSDSWEGRLEIDHQIAEWLGGAIGAQASSRDFEAIGAEAFIPPTASDRLGVFAFEEIGLGDTRAQIGVRFEHQSTDGLDTETSLDYTGFSGSIGLNWSRDDRMALGISVARSVKFPTAEELFSNGPHLATNAFEVGNPGLVDESASSVDATLRLGEGRLTGAFTVFMNRFEGFIYESRTGEVREGLRVFEFVQEDATFVGYEAEAELEIFHRENHHVALLAFSDYVRAELNDSDTPLPRIPPMSIGGGFLYDGGRLHAHANVRRTTRQSRVGPFEEETPGYTLVDASIRYRLFTGQLMHEIVARGTNLTNEEARSHVSFLKEFAPFPGRELQLIYRLGF